MGRRDDCGHGEGGPTNHSGRADGTPAPSALRSRRVRPSPRRSEPGGRVVLIDFIKGKKTPGPPEEMKLSEDQVRQEFAAAGFKQTRKFDFLPEQYFLVFQR